MYERIVGVIVRPFGLRGEMKTRLLTDDAECLTTGQDVQMALGNGSTRVARIRAARHHKGHVLLRVEGVDTVEDAEVWRGAEVRTPKGTAPALQSDTYYSSDLIGMEVRHVDGSTIGTVEDVLRYPAQDLLVVGGSLIPAVAAIVRSVSTEDRLIIVDPPDGLLREGEAPAEPPTQREGEAPAEPPTQRDGEAPAEPPMQREGEAPAEPPTQQDNVADAV